MKKREYNYSTSSSRREIPPPHIHTQSRRLQPEPPPVLPSGTTEYIQRASESSGEFNHFITEHEIKFTKRQVCSPSTCICFFIAILFSFMALLSGIYYGREYSTGTKRKNGGFERGDEMAIKFNCGIRIDSEPNPSFNNTIRPVLSVKKN